MTNEFEVALWVAQHPRILKLALEIQNAKSTSVTEESPQRSLPPHISLQRNWKLIR